MTKRKPATETCLFCGQVIPDKNSDRCDYEHTFVGEKLCFERKEYDK